MPTKPPNRLTPAAVMEDLTGAWRAQAIVGAIELGIFSQIEAKRRTAAKIAEGARASLRGVTALLDALTAMGYLRKTRGHYALQPVAAKFLVPGREAFVGAMAHALSLTWDNWKNLTEAVRSGRPVEAVNVAEKGKEFFPKLVASLFPGNYAASKLAVSHLLAKERRQIRKILDVAAGSGAWSIAFAQAIPDACVTTIDFSELTPITRKFAEKHGVASRYDHLEKDLRQADFGRDVYDLVILGHILHSEGEQHAKELLRKSAAALRPGGKLLIAEYVPNDDRTGPAMPLLFGLNMLLQTEEGAVFTLREYREWLKTAGLSGVSPVPVPPPTSVIIATKKT
jgi:3-hydroxy-5-methyl-1-naphthoate 3-O-methyltransferase